MTNKMIEIPAADHAKASGIRGILQIAEDVRDKNDKTKSISVISRYVAKFKARMYKAKTPLTDVEEADLLDKISEIVNRKD